MIRHGTRVTLTDRVVGLAGRVIWLSGWLGGYFVERFARRPR